MIREQLAGLAMASKWLKSQKTQDSHDIRHFIPVFGRIIKTDHRADNTVLQETPETTKNLKQSSITDFNLKGHSKVAVSQSRPEKAPASTFTTGVRKRIRMVVCSEDGETKTETRHSMPNREINNKENVGSTCQKCTQQESCEPLHSKQTRKRNTSVCTSTLPQEQHSLSRKRSITQDTCSHHHTEHLNDADISPLSKKRKPFKAFTDSKLETDPKLAIGVGVSAATIDSLDSEVYIDTNELLADLSNCEKMIFSDHDQK